jgi:hypothetical protein
MDSNAQFCAHCGVSLSNLDEPDSDCTESEGWCPEDSLVQLQATVSKLSREVQNLNLESLISRLEEIEEVKVFLTTLKE